MSLIELKNVTYQYPLDPEPMIKNLSVVFEKGKVYGLIGRNQSGKTTLCNIIRGFIPTLFFGELAGEVSFRNQSIDSYNIGALAAEIGYAAQNPFTQISGVKETVEEELAYSMENLGIARSVMQKKVNELIELFRLEELRLKNPYELSGGQKQRVALASIMALDPEVIILDEPTSQLDPQSTEEIFEIIAMLKRQGKTVLIVEHKVDLLAEYCDEIILLEDGRIIKQGTTHEVFSDSCILEYGASLPQVALFFLQQLQQENEIPITMVEAIEKLKGAMKR